MTTQKTALGRFDVLDCTTIAAIFDQLDIDSQIRFAASSHELHAAFGGEIRRITGKYRTAFKAAKAGSMILVRYLPVKPGDDENCLFLACRTNNRELAEIAISKGADDWSEGLALACIEGHRELAEMMLERCDEWRRFGYLSFACIGGNIELVKTMLEAGHCDLNDSLNQACEYGHLEIAKLVVEAGATNFDSGYEAAWAHEHGELTAYMVQCGAVAHTSSS